MGSYIDQYIEEARLRSNRSPDELVNKLSTQVFGVMEALSREVEPGSVFATFLGEWARLWVKVWAGSVCAPARAKIEAAALWELSESQVLAGFELAALFRAEGFDRAMGELFQDQGTNRLGSNAILHELQKHHEQSDPRRVAKFIEDGATWLRQETRNNVENIVALLPEVRTWTDEPRANSSLIDALRNEAPTTAAMSWRFVVELQRCRSWGDTGIDDELTRLTGDKTSRTLASWDGLMWVAVVLWGEYRKAIEAQAKAEGKIDRAQAQRNSKVALLLVKDLVGAEIGAVTQVRAA